VLDRFIQKVNQNSRVTGFEFFDDLNSLMMIIAYYEPEEQSVWIQSQLWFWSSRSDAKAKCIIASEVEERVSGFYKDSIYAALLDLVTVCELLFSSPPDKDTPA